MHTIPLRIADPTRHDGTVTFVDGDEHVPVRWSELDLDAKAMAVGLVARGVRPGDHVALLSPTSRELVTAIEAIWLAGATVVVLPLPMRMSSIEEFVDQTRRRIEGADTRLLIVDPQLAPFIEPQPGDPAMVGFEDLVGDPGDYVMPSIDPDSLAVLQFTSGSTSDPKGVMLPHRVVLANVDAIDAALELDMSTDVAVSWLPLYHDMGLIGILTSAMVRGVNLVLAGPQTFMASPSRWMQWISDYKGTITAGPNFAWVLATRALKRLDGLDLSHLRVGLNGAEPVDAKGVEALVAAGERHGLRAGAVFPAFGMAEVAIAGTFPALMSGLRTDDVDQRVLETERYAAPLDADAAGVKRFARLGKPVKGLEIRVVDPVSGDPLKEREVGELQIRGTSVTTGYYKRPDATAATFDGDWLKTGDLAYLVEGELVICGRIKDVIIVAGRNVFPEDVERSVAEIEGVRAGNVIAFGIQGSRREGLVVVAETKLTDASAIRESVAARIRDVVGMSADEVVLVSPGTLPKTSSGKLQRSLCRDRYLDKALEAV
ncbi:MAG: fatty acyl-AMP ligase [Acidimicrobiales bacterium]|nr:fatty acyl-AMP ligase [Acidimicrobiales bacterium]